MYGFKFPRPPRYCLNTVCYLFCLMQTDLIRFFLLGFEWPDLFILFLWLASLKEDISLLIEIECVVYGIQVSKWCQMSDNCTSLLFLLGQLTTSLLKNGPFENSWFVVMLNLKWDPVRFSYMGKSFNFSVSYQVDCKMLLWPLWVQTCRFVTVN